jgi:hypothetical protein
LAKLILKGEGVKRNPVFAAKWLLNASLKGYSPAQALLGHLLWRGEVIKRSAGDGLGLLALAHASASAEDKVWVDELFNAALADATPDDVLEANAFIAQESSALGRRLSNELLIAPPAHLDADASDRERLKQPDPAKRDTQSSQAQVHPHTSADKTAAVEKKDTQPLRGVPSFEGTRKAADLARSVADTQVSLRSDGDEKPAASLDYTPSFR